MTQSLCAIVCCLVFLGTGCAHRENVEQQQEMATQRHINERIEQGRHWLVSREQTQQRMLQVLSPAHQALLARLIGEVATSKDPNIVGAANELDASLSAQEKRNIITADDQLRKVWGAMQPRGLAHPQVSDPGMTLLLTTVSVTSQRVSQAARAQASPNKVNI